MPIVDRIKPIKDTTNNIYGIKRYAKKATISKLGITDRELKSNSHFVYNHKLYGHSTPDWFDILVAFKEYFSCNQIVPVPGHTTEKTELQKMFGDELLKRTKDVKERKYTRTYTLDDVKEQYKDTYEIGNIPPGSKVLLVDAVSNTGISLNYFAEMIEQKGFEVVKLAQGINIKEDKIDKKIKELNETIIVYSARETHEEINERNGLVNRGELTKKDWEDMKLEYITGPYVSVNAYLRAKGLMKGYHRNGALARHCIGWRAERDEYVAETHEEIMEVYKKKQVNRAINSLVEDLVDLDAFRDKLREMLPATRGAKSLNHLANVLEMIIDRHVGVEDLLAQHNPEQNEELQAFEEALNAAADQIWEESEIIDKEKIAEEVAKDIAGDS